MNGSVTQRTYNPKQIEERGREICMEAGGALLALLRSGATASAERIDSLANAVVAGTSMIDAADCAPEPE